MKIKFKLFFAITGSLFFILLILIIFSDKGFIDLSSYIKRKNSSIENNLLLKEKNEKLYSKINRLRNDQNYIENIARREMGMIGKDDIVIKFNEKKKEEPDE